jgi:uncharacterized protein YceH (UPF0502 family)
VDSPLSEIETRIIGSLIEKELTTPDYYPLSLNALTTACNQTSNRDPIAHYAEDAIAHAIEPLRRRSLVRVVQQSGSRVFKYKHLINETLGLVSRQTAVLCVMMLRGPQTLGELKTRTARMAEFDSLDDVETAVEQLINREPEPLAARLTRRPGQKEDRYAHLLAGEVTYEVPDHPSPARSPDEGRPDRIAALEQTVEALRKEVTELRGQLEAFRKQFE